MRWGEEGDERRGRGRRVEGEGGRKEGRKEGRRGEWGGFGRWRLYRLDTLECAGLGVDVGGRWVSGKGVCWIVGRGGRGGERAWMVLPVLVLRVDGSEGVCRWTGGGLRAPFVLESRIG